MASEQDLNLIVDPEVRHTWLWWNGFFEAGIIDPDGFRDDPDDATYTAAEFRDRLPRCTVRVNPSLTETVIDNAIVRGLAAKSPPHIAYGVKQTLDLSKLHIPIEDIPSLVIDASVRQAKRLRLDYDHISEEAGSLQRQAQLYFDKAAAAREQAERIEKWLDIVDPEWRGDSEEDWVGDDEPPDNEA